MFRCILLSLALLVFHDEIPIDSEPEPLPVREEPKKIYPEEKGEFVGTKGDTKFTFRANKDLLKEENPNHVYWYKDGKLHRDGGPAIEYIPTRIMKWYQHGELHRDEGPAVETPQFKVWYRHGIFIGSSRD